MLSTNIREINDAIEVEKFKGTRTVKTATGFRVIKARTKKGQLQAKLLDGKWVNIESIIIEYPF